MAEAYEALTSLRKVLTVKRETHKEELAHGHSDHEERVGRCKGLEWAIERINEQIKSLTQGSDDGERELKN